MKSFLSMFDAFRHLSPTRMRQRLLEDAQRDLVETAKNREYYAAMEAMLVARVIRLTEELKVK